MARLKCLIPVLLLFSTVVLAQQDPQFTQYLYNQSIINPAYTTNEKLMLNFGGFYRSQWQNVDGSPETVSFFMHAPLSEKVETGISVISDDIGDGALKETNIYADFAYILKLNEKSNLSLGLKAGLTSIDSNFGNVVLPESGNDFLSDSAFNGELDGSFPNIGVGAFYNRENWFLGLSAPNLINSQYLDDSDGIIQRGAEETHFFFMGGYVYTINENLKLKPSFLTKIVAGAPLSVDMSTNVLIANRFEAGASYRLEDAIMGMFRFNITPALSLGYAYDYTLSNLGNFSAGSHEVMVLFNFDMLGLRKGFDKSPRFY